MEKSKITKKILKLKESLQKAEHGEQDELNAFVLQIKDDNSVLLGYSQNPIMLNNCVIITDFNNEVNIYGQLNGEIVTKTNSRHQMISIGVDMTKNNKKQVFIDCDNSAYIFSDSEFDINDKFLMYWQYNADHFLLTVNGNINNAAVFSVICENINFANSSLNTLTKFVINYIHNKNVGGDLHSEFK